MSKKTHSECGRMGGLATKGVLSVVCPITHKTCYTAPYVELSEKSQAAPGRKQITREQRQEWGRMGRAVAGRGKPKQAAIPQ